MQGGVEKKRSRAPAAKKTCQYCKKDIGVQGLPNHLESCSKRSGKVGLGSLGIYEPLPRLGTDPLGGAEPTPRTSRSREPRLPVHDDGPKERHNPFSRPTPRNQVSPELEAIRSHEPAASVPDSPLAGTLLMLVFILVYGYVLSGPPLGNTMMDDEVSGPQTELQSSMGLSAYPREVRVPAGTSTSATRLPLPDDIKVETHPSAKIPPVLYSYEDYNTHLPKPDPLLVEPPGKREPWFPFKSKLDFEVAEFMQDQRFNNEQSKEFMELIEQIRR